MKTWSYSSISTFKQCPKKYYHLRVLKDVKDDTSAALVYGRDAHKAAEHYVKDGTPLPQVFSFMQGTLDAFNAIEGDKHCEIRFGVKRSFSTARPAPDLDYEPCKFFADDVWWRGIADLLIINGTRGYLVDYKTGKNARYADTKQLDLLAAATFTHFPEIETLKSALVYVVSNDFIKKEHKAELRDSYFATFDPELERLAGAEESGVWNAISGPLCRFCPVLTCEHNRRD
tara:strand:+ start:126 stop:815 length:690 start_codon:yes stop_codon:yes gene_type:complete